MIHLYYGDGKGKTSAAMGAALRALGHGMRVVIVQFLKDGNSGELAPLKRLGAAVWSGNGSTKFFAAMSDAEKEEGRIRNTENLRKALEDPCDMLILDEACAACRYGMVDEELVRLALTRENMEIILTGRQPAGWMLEAADYITRMEACRHPYEKGITAREGIEF